MDKTAESIASWIAKCEELSAENKKLQDQLSKIKFSVTHQAEDGSIWFKPDSITEAYLQQSLRWLHHVIEGTDPKALINIMEQADEHRMKTDPREFN